MAKKKEEPSIGKQRMDAVLLAFNVRTYIQTLVSDEQANLMLDALGEGIDEDMVADRLGPGMAAPFLAMVHKDEHDTIRAIANIALGNRP